MKKTLAIVCVLIGCVYLLLVARFRAGNGFSDG